jgi:hypothetical protein
MPRKNEDSAFLDAPLDRMAAATTTALSRGRAMKPTSALEAIVSGRRITYSDAYWRAYEMDPDVAQRRKHVWLEGVVGFSDPNEALWEVLKKWGPLAVQMNCLLWNKVYLGHGVFTREEVTLDLDEVARELGYAELQNGNGTRTRTLRTIYDVLAALMTIRMDVCFHVHGKPTRLLQGPIWNEGVYEQTARQSASGSTDFVPKSFSYRIGSWFEKTGWAKQHRCMGVVSRAFLRMRDVKRDKWAILVGGYLTIMASLVHYEDLLLAQSLRVAQIERETGILDGNDTPKERRDRLTRALNRCREVGVIEQWRWLGEDRIEVVWPEELKSEAARLRQELQDAELRTVQEKDRRRRSRR